MLLPESIQLIIQHLPEKKREQWLAFAWEQAGLKPPPPCLADDGSSDQTSTDTPAFSLQQQLTDLPPTPSQLSRIQKALEELQEAARQARWIRFLLLRPHVNAYWKEAWSEVITLPEVIAALNKSPELAVWFSQSMAAASPPDPFELIPQLDSNTLKQMRAAIDRTFKQLIRHARRFSPIDADQLTDPSPQPLKLARLSLAKAVEALDSASQTAIYLRFFEGYTLQAIASHMGLPSPTHVHRLIAKALEELRKNLTD